MAEFYHVSRADISSLKELSLINFEGIIEAEDFYNPEEFKRYKSELYPDGISKHGEIYLHNAFKATGPNLAFTPNEFLIETTFEIIRRLKFPNRKSRFECSFACLTIEDALRIRVDQFNHVGKIYKVSCDKFSIADMNLLRQGGSILGIQIMAEKYWSGIESRIPLFEVLMETPIQIIEEIAI